MHKPMGTVSMKNDIDFDIPTLASWLNGELGGMHPIEAVSIRGGGSCELFEIRRNGQRLVMRRAPVSAVSSTAHDVLREYRIIHAMQNSRVRVPKVMAACDDVEIAGNPFYVMEFIDGEVIRRSLPEAYRDDTPSQIKIGEELIDALVELHAFDWRNSKLSELVKPGNFLERQVQRWLSQYSEYQQRDLPVEVIAKWLEKNRPAQGELTVMHGDYKIDNTMLSRETPPRILRLVDFEMTAIGDPLIDLAWAMIFWPEEGNLLAIAPPNSEGGMDSAYCQSPEALVQRYAEQTGRDVSNFQWYQVFAAWKLGIVLEASYVKFLNGKSKNANHEFFGFVVDELMSRAARFAQLANLTEK